MADHTKISRGQHAAPQGCQPSLALGGGAGQKSRTGPGPSPSPLSRAEFFSADGNFDLFGNPVSQAKHPRSRSQRAADRRTPELRQAIRKLAEAGVTRAQIARHVGIGETTLYHNYFSEIGCRPGKVGRMQHDATADRRRVVCALAEQGSSQREIAAALGITIPTLTRHYRANLSRSIDDRKGISK